MRHSLCESWFSEARLLAGHIPSGGSARLGMRLRSFTAVNTSPNCLLCKASSRRLRAFRRRRIRSSARCRCSMWAMTEMDAESFLQKFRGIATRTVVISSGDVYRAYGRLMGLESGRPDPIPLNENSPLRESRYRYQRMAPNPDHWMARYDKVLVEQVLMHQTDLPTCILRFPAVVGPQDYRRFQRWLHRCCGAMWNCAFRRDGHDGAGPMASPRTSLKLWFLPSSIPLQQDESITLGSATYRPWWNVWWSLRA